jgi:GDP-L-fucose synthase
MENFHSRDIGEFINIGTGVEIRIKNLAEKISQIAGFRGTITWDTTKPNGTPRKLLDVSHLKALGWEAKTGLDEGLALAYEDFKENYGKYASGSHT